MLAGQQHELLVSGPAADPYMYQATVLSAGAAMALVFWDAVLTLGDEVDYIWSGPGRAHVKCIYLFSRWFGLLNQIGLLVWRCFLAACAPVPLSICEVLFVSEAVTFQSLQLCLDAILILRIYAVYQGQRRYIAIAIAIVFFEVLMSVMTQAISVSRSTVDGACIMLHTPATTTCLGIGMMVSQSVLLSLTYRGMAPWQPAARRSKLTTVVVRDGMLVFGVVIGIVLISFLYFLFNQVVLNVFLPWMPVLPSLLTPRMILNMQMATEPTESIMELTTDLGTLQNNEIRPSSLHRVVVIYEQPREPP
ncbi:hypothetical protein EV363DRAFT_12917 [Boletus edulis]|uniref:DUF6533 domain-containing protein n=1 Tax=Boletus edulis BED1 TaxID=1328754 RepID=A0AAD4GJC8_BOLED|nr:hypothetical protein EV363DRAFT_12917 [Boletus edulis]KAF8448771.1 hypothetical protein L210DRAFT_3523090 [Boletus edulis BED1]